MAAVPKPPVDPLSLKAQITPMIDGFIVHDQSAVAALLSDPVTHAGAVPQKIDTHGAMVFLAGDRVYKVKRAVRFPFMDFSTLDKRHAALLEELRVNRRTAPGLYLGLAPITRQSNGRLALGAVGDPSGDAVEFALVMNRFEATLDDRARAGTLDPDDLNKVAEAIAAFHHEAEPYIRVDPVGRVADAIAGVVREMRQNPDILAPAKADAFEALMQCRHAACTARIRARSQAGLERHCHGDLHLRNICLFDGEPTLFDAIEFNADFARIDVLYDLAFLLMDLEARGERGLANRVLNIYLDRRALDEWPDEAGLAQLPLFLALRAGIKSEIGAHMAGLQSDPGQAEDLRAGAAAYLDQALGYLAPSRPRLIAVGGLSGSGKSTLAGALSPMLNPAPGARWLRSDVLRKAWAGLAPLDRLPSSNYTAEASAETYRRLMAVAGDALAAGQSVVLDAVFARPWERIAVEALAARFGVSFTGLWLDAPQAVRIDRVVVRTDDPSDAGANVAAAQEGYELGPIRWHRIDAAQGAVAVLEHARSLC